MSPTQRRTLEQFDEIFDHAAPIVYGYALRLCGGDHDQAADLTQDAWVTALRHRPNPTDLPSIQLLIVAARCRFIDDLRRARRLPGKLALMWSAGRAHHDDPLDDMIEVDQIDRLAPELRAIAVLLYVDDFPCSVSFRLTASSSTSNSYRPRSTPRR